MRHIAYCRISGYLDPNMSLARCLLFSPCFQNLSGVEHACLAALCLAFWSLTFQGISSVLLPPKTQHMELGSGFLSRIPTSFYIFSIFLIMLFVCELEIVFVFPLLPLYLLILPSKAQSILDLTLSLHCHRDSPLISLRTGIHLWSQITCSQMSKKPHHNPKNLSQGEARSPRLALSVWCNSRAVNKQQGRYTGITIFHNSTEAENTG